MIAMLSFRRIFALLSILSLIGSGCSSTAQFTALQPAEADVGGLRKLAVCNFEGASGTGESATSAIMESLGEHEYYVVATTERLSTLAPVPLYNEHGQLNKRAALEAANRLGADLLLVGDVKLRKQDTVDLGGPKIQFGGRDVTIGVGFELVNVRNGQVMLADRVTETHVGDPEHELRGPKTVKETYNRLATTAAAKVVERITPHQQKVEVKLAGGITNGDIRKGNSLAHDGDWNSATQQWRAALADDPANHAAMYNIGLACEAMNDFGQAAHMYAAALEQEDSELYREAAKRVLKSGEQFQLASVQLHQGPRLSPAPGYAVQTAARFASPLNQQPYQQAAAYSGHTLAPGNNGQFQPSAMSASHQLPSHPGAYPNGPQPAPVYQQATPNMHSPTYR